MTVSDLVPKNAISVDIPESGGEITVHYFSRRSHSVVSRSGVLEDHVTEEGERESLIILHDTEYATIVDLEELVVLSLTENQETVLGELVAIETPEDAPAFSDELAFRFGGGFYLSRMDSGEAFATLIDENADSVSLLFDELVALEQSISPGEMESIQERRRGSASGHPSSVLVSLHDVRRVLGWFLYHES